MTPPPVPERPTPEVWLRGPVMGVVPVLQPVAHALLQLAEDLPPLLASLTPQQIWSCPGGSASIGFHAAHLAGSLDRLFTYARAESLSSPQRHALQAERNVQHAHPPIATLVAQLRATLEAALDQLRNTSADVLLEARLVGRAELPSTVLGLLFHAAEHSARHGGQIVTLVRVLRSAPHPL